MSVQKRTWDPNKTFDLSSDELRAIQERAQRASKLRSEWQKKLSSPYKPVGSYIFDPALQRFISMRANYWPMFKPTIKNFAYAFTGAFLPIIAMAWWIDKDRSQREKEYREGKVAYRDRYWKFI
ncbi:DgyrCDS9825 [Dimorphilus gyrociliatus]|uniref:NADH dehydrogenase [ubiquinone] 1 beta subcomplex subunit 4 n=1 Tax=Dimorphilus gyrociliatus TaxID=2664684 RepID=A0A7I8VY62_9ANNE|nr:DgyrCDS9825 [Dimorphilus gyrociliatus]